MWDWSGSLMTVSWWPTCTMFWWTPYHGRGIASTMIGIVKEKYKNYLYIEIMLGESKNASFYEWHGFQVMPDGIAMQLCNFADKR